MTREERKARKKELNDRLSQVDIELDMGEEAERYLKSVTATPKLTLKDELNQQTPVHFAWTLFRIAAGVFFVIFGITLLVLIWIG